MMTIWGYILSHFSNYSHHKKPDITKLRTQFDALTAKHGGRFNKEGVVVGEHAPDHPLVILDYLPRIFTAIQQELADKNGPRDREDVICGIDRIYIDFIQNLQFNALAANRYGHEFIGINVGLPLKFHQYFNTLFTARDILPHIGEAATEENDLKSVKEMLISNYDSMSTFGRITPKSGVRKEFAMYLSHFATLFTLNHEMAHHFCGHITHLKITHAIDEYLEVAPSRSKERPFSNLDIQSMEIEADTYALALTYSDVVKFYRMNDDEQLRKRFSMEGSLKDAVPNPTDLLAWTMIFVFHVFQDQSSQAYVASSSLHPHPRVRRMNALLALSRMPYAEEEGDETARMERYMAINDAYEQFAPQISKFEVTAHHSQSDLLKEMRRLQERVFAGPLRAELEARIVERIQAFG